MRVEQVQTWFGNISLINDFGGGGGVNNKVIRNEKEVWVHLKPEETIRRTRRTPKNGKWGTGISGSKQVSVDVLYLIHVLRSCINQMTWIPGRNRIETWFRGDNGACKSGATSCSHSFAAGYGPYADARDTRTE